MKIIGDSALFRWDRFYLPGLVLICGIGFVVAMYTHGGLSAIYPFNFLGLMGYFMIVYTLVSFGIVNRENNAPKLLADMIHSARRSIKIFSGSINSTVYLREIGRGTPLESLVDKAVKGILVEIITQWEPDPATIKALQDIAGQRDMRMVKRNLKLFQLRSGSQSSQEHFMVVDDSWIRIETAHGPGEPNRRNRSSRFSARMYGVLNHRFADLIEETEEKPFLETWSIVHG